MATIEQLRALDAKATGGPWRWSDEFGTSDNRDTWSLVGGNGYGILSCDGIGNSPQTYRPNDAALIVEMRAALPALLKVAEAAKAYYSLASGPYDDTREGEFLELQAELGKALSELEAQ